MENQIDLKDIHKLVDNFAVSLVGILCKRVELIQKVGADKSSQELIKLYPDLFKNLSKELIYENCRQLKQRITASTIPTVVYKGK